MMSTMRKYLQSGQSKVLIWILMILFMGTGSLGLIEMLLQQKSPSTLAKVNGSEISIFDFRRVFAPLAYQIQELKRAYGEQAQLILQMYGLGDKSPEDMALDQLVRGELMADEAQSLQLHISSDYIAEKLQDQKFVSSVLPDLVSAQLFSQGKLDPYLLNQYVSQLGMSEQDFERLVARKLKEFAYVMAVYGGAYASPDQIKENFISRYSPKKYAIVSFSLDPYIAQAQKAQATDEELQQFYKQHADLYRVPEKRRGVARSFTPDSYGIMVSHADAQKYYNQHKQEFVESPAEFTVNRIVVTTDVDNTEQSLKVQAQVRKVTHELKQNPDAFDQVMAKLEKKLQGAAEASYTTTTFKQGDASKEVASLSYAVDALTVEKPVSDVIRTADGFEVVKLVQKKPAEFKPFKVVEQRITEQLKKDLFSKRFAADAGRIINQSKDNPALLSKFIENKQAQEEDIVKDSSDSGLSARKLFSLTKQRPTGFIEENGTGKIIMLKKIEASFIKPFADVRAQVVRDYYAQQARALQDKDVLQARKRIVKDPTQVKNIPGSTTTTTEWIDPEQPKTQEPLRAIGLSSQTLNNLDRVGQSELHEQGDVRYIVVLEDIAPFNEDYYAQKKDTLRQQLVHEQARELVSSILAWRKNNAQIEVDKRLLRAATRQ